MRRRMCSRIGCSGRAVATLTYVYADSTAVLGPLGLSAVPGSYDLCPTHSASTSAPRGWQIIRLPELSDELPEPDEDDLLALANAIREVGMSCDEPTAEAVGQNCEIGAAANIVVLAQRRHLRVIADA